MEAKIDADAVLGYAEFQLFPSQDRYDACIRSGGIVETVASGHLGQLVLHLPELKGWISRGSKANVKLQPPKNVDSCQWFTKSTLTRFLHIVGSSDELNTANAIGDEITQLEEARKFHLSLYTKEEVNNSSSDASKNELLRAMNLRLTALKGELASAFNRAAGAACSSKHISDMEKLSQHFGAIALRNNLQKFVELSQMGQTADLPSDEKSPSKNHTRTDRDKEREGNDLVLKPSNSDTPVKYGVSPAKVAQIERQSSTESEESSDSSGEDQPSVERSRALVRSASPRRSASPMRRVQIGRSGSRRATALTIKSLNYFPARDKTLSSKDATANSSEDEGSEQPPKRSDSNIQRMSVQDAISLFEGKQRVQTSDVQKRRSTIDAFAAPNKSVLRRWSAGTGESSTQYLPEKDPGSSDPMASDNLEGGEFPRTSFEEKPETQFISPDNNAVEAVKVDANLVTFEERTFNPVSYQADTVLTEREENPEKLTASAEWNQQKEDELNQMLMKMMETKPVRYQNAAPDINRSQDTTHERKGGFYDHYKGKRDDKIRGETAGKRAEKAAQFRAMQQVLDERKAEMASTSVSGRKTSVAKPQKSNKSLTPSVIPKKEPSKPAVAKKALSKASPSHAMRKSWPSTPSTRVTTGTSPAKTPCGTSSAGTTPTRQKPQLAPSVPRSSPKSQRPLQKPKNVKPGQSDTRKSMTEVIVKQQQSLTKNGKITKTKVQISSGKDGSTVAAKPSFYSKVTKKSSVVPLEPKPESKPFLRKGSGMKTKAASQPEETLKRSDLIQVTQENELVADTFDPVSQQQEGDSEALETHAGLESESPSTSQQKCEETVSSGQAPTNCDNSVVITVEPEVKVEAEEESVISPAAWVEKEEPEDLPIPYDDRTCQITSPANATPPRIRHSLSQMLLEESAEPDIIEWGNAENPPALVFQKDVPKGLKRLLKFARKSRADTNSGGWSSPSGFSEGEDDAEESKAVSKKNADNLRRKAALQAKNHGRQTASLGEGYEQNSASPELSAHSHTSKFSVQSSSHKFQDHISVGATTTKATRSFFSLSAFRGSKPNETKLR